MGISIERGEASDPGVPELFAAADAYGLSLYASENYHALDAADLAPDDVLLIARAGTGEALGMVALVTSAAEVKRMYVSPAARGAGVGRALLEAIESVARERGIRTLRLETGEPQGAAIALYESAGYLRVPAFGAYREDPTSVCMAKSLVE